MSDDNNSLLIRLVGEVAGLKSDVKNQAESQKEQWGKLDRMSDTLTDVNRKLDQMVDHEERLEVVEKGVADYRKTKGRALSLVTGLGLGAGGFSASIANMIGKWFNGQ